MKSTTAPVTHVHGEPKQVEELDFDLLKLRSILAMALGMLLKRMWLLDQSLKTTGCGCGFWHTEPYQRSPFF